MYLNLTSMVLNGPFLNLNRAHLGSRFTLRIEFVARCSEGVLKQCFIRGLRARRLPVIRIIVTRIKLNITHELLAISYVRVIIFLHMSRVEDKFYAIYHNFISSTHETWWWKNNVYVYLNNKQKRRQIKYIIYAERSTFSYQNKKFLLLICINDIAYRLMITTEK